MSMTTVPFHYRDDKAETPCDTAGQEGWTEGETCSRGCEGARMHYANDGHDECTDDAFLRRL